MGYLECGIEILAGIGNRGVEVPIKDEKIDTEAVGPCQLLFYSTVVIVLPTRKRFTILIGTIGHSVEVEVSERSRPTIKIICAEASNGLSRSRWALAITQGTVNIAEVELPPPGAGLKTVTAPVPATEISSAPI